MSWADDANPGARPDPAVLAAEAGRLVAGSERHIAAPPKSSLTSTLSPS